GQTRVAADTRSRRFPLLRFGEGFLGVAAGFFEKTAARHVSFFRHAKAARVFVDGTETADFRAVGCVVVPDGGGAGAATDCGADSHAGQALAVASVDVLFFRVGRDFR